MFNTRWGCWRQEGLQHQGGCQCQGGHRAKRGGPRRRNRGLEEKEVERGDLVYNLPLFTHNSQLSTTLTNVPAFSCAIYGQNLELFFLPVSFQAVKILIFWNMLYKGDPQRWNDCPLRLKYYYKDLAPDVLRSLSSWVLPLNFRDHFSFFAYIFLMKHNW